MKTVKQAKIIEENVFDLIGQIDSGDISNIDTFWESLRDALLKLSIPGWDNFALPKKAKAKVKAKVTDKVKAMINARAKVSDVLKSLKEVNPDLLDDTLLDETLIDKVSEMEELSFAGSENSIDKEDLETLQSMALDFETLFTKFLDKITESYEK